MRRYFLIVLLISFSFSKSQNFYEKIIAMNIENADTSNDRAVLDMSAKAMDRVSRGTGANWDVAFHMALCFVRMTDISLNLKDTIGAKIALGMSISQMKKIDTMSLQHVETKVLEFYHKINQLRIGKQNAKKIRSLESQLEDYKNLNSNNPRIYLVNAYYYRCFVLVNKEKRKKALDLLKQAELLFALEKAKDNAPHWGKKWMNEMILELNSKAK